MPKAPQPAAVRPRILLVEDDAALRRALTFSLRIEGYEVDAMDRGEALLDHALEGSAVIVIDQNLPDLTGLECLARLGDRGAAPPAILITAELPARLKAQADRLGATVVQKPILGDALITALRGIRTA